MFWLGFRVYKVCGFADLAQFRAQGSGFRV